MFSTHRFTTFGQRVVAAGLTAALAFGGLTGCAGEASSASSGPSSAPSTQEGTAQVASASAGSYVSLVDTTDLFSKRDLDPSYESDEVTATIALADGATTVTGSGASVEADVVTISEEGIYEVSGTLANGQILVDAPDAKVQLVLSGASVTSGSSAAIYVREAKKVFLTLADGTESELATSGAFVAIDDNDIDGVIFAKDGLTINGTGSLAVGTDHGNGIVAKDELTLVDASVTVDVSGDAVQANDWVAVSGGTYALASDEKALKVSGNDDDDALGFLYVADGTFALSSTDDGVNAAGAVQIDGGTWNVETGDDGIHADGDLAFNGGDVTVSRSNEGLEASSVTIAGGNIDVTSSDDGVNATGESGGTGSDGFGFGGGGFGGGMGGRPEWDDGEMPEPPDGWFGDGEMPEGFDQPKDGAQDASDGAAATTAASEGDATFRPAEGEVEADDANPGDAGRGGGGFGGHGGFGGGMMMDTDETARITITGGRLTVNASGDGLDSNGSVSIEGGETYVSGSTNDGNAALDFGLEGTISGGTFVATGMAGMAERFSSDSEQASAIVYLDGTTSGAVSLADADGTELLSFDAPKEYNCVVVSAEGMEVGGTYTLTCGDSETEVVVDSVSASVGTASSFMGGGFGGGMGRRRGDLGNGQLPEGGFGGELPEDFGGQAPDGFGGQAPDGQGGPGMGGPRGGRGGRRGQAGGEMPSDQGEV